jgi:acyltransferase-like protein
MMSDIIDTRRYDLDWLRVLAFLLLIFYHIGQFYVADWGWHVKSAYQSSFLQNIMLLVNQWRMPLIFLISGAVLCLIEAKINRYKLFQARFIRLIFPLLFGMFLIVPPQVYYELVQNEGYAASYWEFYLLYLDTSSTMYAAHQLISSRTGLSFGLITYNHLWYLLYLFTYTLLYMVIKPLLIKINWQAVSDEFSVYIIVPVTLFFIYSMFLSPYYPDTFVLLGDWYKHALYFTSFILGYVMAKSPKIWQAIIDKRKAWLVLAIISYTLVVIRFNRAWFLNVSYDSASMYMQIFIHFIWSANKVFWLFALIGFSGAYLKRKSSILTYMNDAVLPWYILHQTLIIIFAMWLDKFKLGSVLEPILLIISTIMGCFIGYEIIKRFALTRFMFGLKYRKTALSVAKINF